MIWSDCVDKGSVRKSSPDVELAKSLIKISDSRLQFIKSIKINLSNASILTAESYEALREICEAVIVIRGFKVYSHECITAFLKEILKDEISAEVFDRYRKIRNSINYYGRQVSAESAEQAVIDISKIITRIKFFIKT